MNSGNKKKDNTANGSESDNIPLSYLIGKRKLSEMDDSDSDSGLDKTYKPFSNDLNSIDSEYLSDAFKNTERNRKRKGKTTNVW